MLRFEPSLRGALQGCLAHFSRSAVCLNIELSLQLLKGNGQSEKVMLNELSEA